MNETTQPYKLAKAAPVSWFQFATRHRAGIASLVVLLFPLVHAVHGASGEHSDLRLCTRSASIWSTAISACCRSDTPRCSAPALTSAASRSCISRLPWFAAIAVGIARRPA